MTITPMPNTENYQDDEISLIDIFNFIKEGWQTIAASVVLAAVLALGYISMIKPQYEASASLISATVDGKEVQPLTILSAIVSLPGYFDVATHQACGVKSAGNWAKIINPTLNKKAPFLDLSFKGRSQAEAQNCMTTVVNFITQQQKIIAQPIIDGLNRQIEENKTLQAQLLQLREHANQHYSSADFVGKSFLLATISADRIEEIQLRTQAYNLRTSLALTNTHDTQLVTPIYAPMEAVPNKKWMILLLASLAGGMLSVLWLAGRRFWRNAQTASA
jgi:LPS O-antigen subunit length determinant protein (WzzB/FepE family)